MPPGQTTVIERLGRVRPKLDRLARCSRVPLVAWLAVPAVAKVRPQSGIGVGHLSDRPYRRLGGEGPFHLVVGEHLQFRPTNLPAPGGPTSPERDLRCPASCFIARGERLCQGPELVRGWLELHLHNDDPRRNLVLRLSALFRRPLRPAAPQLSSCFWPSPIYCGPCAANSAANGPQCSKIAITAMDKRCKTGYITGFAGRFPQLAHDNRLRYQVPPGRAHRPDPRRLPGSDGGRVP